MNNEFKDYTQNFLQDTLGLSTILVEAAKNTSTVILVENLNSYNADELELLNKMIAALKWSSPVEILDLKAVVPNESVKIILKDHPQSSGETYSARTLLAYPEYKRQAWDDLKNAFRIT